MVKLWEDEIRIQTEYDKEGDPKSRDSSMTIVIEDPTSQPRLHKSLPGV